MRPGLVIFDCDGVPVDIEPVAVRVASGNLSRHGPDLSPERCMDLLLGRRMAAATERARRPGARPPDGWGTEVLVAPYAAPARWVRAIPGVAGLLDLPDDAGIAHCVASNGSDETIRITPGPAGLVGPEPALR